ncbi:hypothetical protein [Sphingobium yanoikuyae]|nr:hypothetical protein [Sphingobium yanoikuyae]
MTLINPTSALAAQVDGLTADQIADGESKVSMTVGERAGAAVELGAHG